MLLTHLAYLSAIVLLVSLVPPVFVGEAKQAILVVGLLGAWRYSWAALNYLRALWFRHWAYPRRKARAAARYDARGVSGHAFFLTTSYKIDQEVTVPVYRSVFAAAGQSAGGATIVASVVDGADDRLIRTVFDNMDVDMSQVALVVDRIPGTGKRDALARALSLIAQRCPTREDIIIFVDGDTCVPEDIVSQSVPIFTDPGIGALTTDEAVMIPENSLFREWFRLRFDQRQVMMCSMGLAERVLTLTGRMSVFRADLATQPSFIEQVRHDYLDHWRLGRVNFLTGDDKSTWFWLIRNGYRMAYLPDVQSISAETQPKPTFAGSAAALMVRWFGNMLRTNGRAVGLGPRTVGFFTWWSILDQKVSIWTTLIGPSSALIAAAVFDPIILPAYIAWVMLTRYIYVTLVTAFRGRIGFPITYPFILYFSQLFGALVKSYVLFRLDRQKWTRQGSGSVAKAARPGLAVRAAAFSSAYLHALTVGWLTMAVLYLTGVV